jgi:MOSC domain-containing protein YiiM
MRQTAHIFQINVSPGGVPKHSIRQAQVGELGIEGDRVANPDVHGGPDRAVCLYSLDLILALQAEGHPIFPGAVGENITLANIDWSRLVPGARIRLGEKATLEVTRYTSPCETIADSFVDGYFNRISHKLREGWSRVYARVLVTGPIRVGDPVLIL